jgi:hypothetical protein
VENVECSLEIRLKRKRDTFLVTKQKLSQLVMTNYVEQSP